MKRSMRSFYLYASMAITAFGAHAQSPDLAIYFGTPTGFVPGESTHYVMRFASLGAVAQNATIVDVLPAYTSFVSANPAPGWSCNPATVAGQPAVRCSTPSLAPQPPFSEWASMSIDVSIPADLPVDTILTNTVTISSDDTDPHPENNTALYTVRPPATDYFADVSTTSSVAPSAVPVGGVAVITVVVLNQGPSSALYTTFEDNLPPFLSFVSLDAPGWSCDPPPVGSSGRILCDRHQFLPGIEPVRITVRADQAARGTNTVHVDPGAVDFTQDDWDTAVEVVAGGPAVATVPTLSFFSLAALGGLLAGAGVFLLRSRA